MAERLMAITGKGFSDGTVDGLSSFLFAVGRIFSENPRCFFNGVVEPDEGASRKCCSSARPAREHAHQN